MSEWKEYKLNSLCKVGSSKRIFSFDYVISGIPFFRSKEIIEKSFGDSITEPLFISELRFKEIDEKFGSPKEGDILISSVGARSGIPYLVTKKDGRFYFKDGNLIWIKSFSENLDSTFLLYWLKSNIGQESLASIMIGSAQPALTIDGISNLLIEIPDVKIQKIIADILSCLDEKIENLRRQNETLEKIAQTLFKHWFIDFEFPFDFAQSKPNADGKPYKFSGGVMVPSELGDIPEGWCVGTLGDYIYVKHGYAFKGEYITTEETQQILLTPGNFKIGGGFNDSKYKFYSDEYYPDEYILKKKDLTITMTDLSKEGDTLGYPAFIPEVKEKVFLHNQRIGKIENNKIDKVFLYFLLCRREYRSHILGTSPGSTVRHTSPSRIYDFFFTIPDFKLIERFSNIATSTIDKILINFEKIQTLTKIRDSLLPKLMSGQIRVEE